MAKTYGKRSPKIGSTDCARKSLPLSAAGFPPPPRPARPVLTPPPSGTPPPGGGDAFGEQCDSAAPDCSSSWDMRGYPTWRYCNVTSDRRPLGKESCRARPVRCGQRSWIERGRDG